MFIMEKLIKKYGNSAIITLSSEDLTIMGLKIGDVFKFKRENELIKQLDNQDAEIEKYFKVTLNQTYKEYLKIHEENKTFGATEYKLTKDEFAERQTERKKNHLEHIDLKIKKLELDKTLIKPEKKKS